MQFHILFKRCKALLSAPFLIPSPGSSSCVSVLSLSLSFHLSLHPSLSSSPPHPKPPPVTQEPPHSFPLPCTPLPAAGIWGGGGMLGWEITNTSSAPHKQRDAGSCPPHQHSSSLWVSAPPSTPATNGFQTRHHSGIRYGIFRFPQSYKPS